MATINIAEFATIIDATPRDARKFLREVTDEENQPGKGGRWAIEKREVRSLKSKFAKWDDERKAPANDEVLDEGMTGEEVNDAADAD